MAASKVHAEDSERAGWEHGRRSICHTYVTSRRNVIMATKPEEVTCTKCLAKLAK